MTWIFTLYLLYGLAFFTLGISIFSRDIKLSKLGIARILWLLAMFGIIHGAHEWLELLDHLNNNNLQPFFLGIKLLTITLSFLFLLYFGIFIILIAFAGDDALKRTPKSVKAIIGITALSVILTAIYLDYHSGKDMHIRYLVAFPGGLLSGIGLILYSRTAQLYSEKASINFVFAGIFMICYAILAGIVPSSYIIPYINTQVILFRGICAFLIMLFTIRALSVFNVEQAQQINERLLRFSESEKLSSMGILAAGIAHEINNPLANASLNLEMLKDLTQTNDRLIKKVEAIERNIGRASNIARQLLHFSRNEEIEPVPTDINKIITNSINLLRNQPKFTIIEKDLDPIPEVMAIPWKLEEVFINLLLNSLDACNENDRIIIQTRTEDAAVTISVTDTGIGIAEENIKKIFDPFFTTKKIGEGTGLGLSISYTIIKQHQGTIRIHNKENGGTMAIITLPVIENGR